MPSLTYFKTTQILDNLKRIEFLRGKIHALLLSRQDELKLRWDATVYRIYYSLSLYDLSISKRLVLKSLSLSPHAKTSSKNKMIVQYKETLDWINQNWFMNPSIISAHDIATIHRQLWKSPTVFVNHELDDMLVYLQSAGDHPFLQSLIAQLAIYNGNFLPDHNRELSHLIHYLFLIKHGLDFRGFFVPEHYYFHERVYFKDVITKSYINSQVAGWLDYATDGTVKSLTNILTSAQTQSVATEMPEAFFELNERQKYALGFLEAPGSTISNRVLQKKFGISQITSSRDLSKLCSFGLVFAKGKGRATVYSRS